MRLQKKCIHTRARAPKYMHIQGKQIQYNNNHVTKVGDRVCIKKKNGTNNFRMKNKKSIYFYDTYKLAIITTRKKC